MRKSHNTAEANPRRKLNNRMGNFSKEDVSVYHGSYIVTTPNGKKYRRSKTTWHGVDREESYADDCFMQQDLDRWSAKMRGWDYDF